MYIFNILIKWACYYQKIKVIAANTHTHTKVIVDPKQYVAERALITPHIQISLRHSMTLQRVILIVLVNEAKRKPSRARFYGGEKKTSALSTFSTLNLPPKLDWEETARRKHKKFNYNEAQYFFLVVVVFTLCQLKEDFFCVKRRLNRNNCP